MSAAELARDSGLVVVVAGLVLTLAPLGPRLPSARRWAGIALVLAGWALVAVTLTPDAVTDRLDTPVGIGAAVVLGALAVAVGALLVRLVLARPWLWFVLLAVSLPVRIPVPQGDGESANLLLPLYLVMLVGLAAWMWSARPGGAMAGLRPTTPLDLPILAFVGFTLVSALWSGDAEEAAVKAVFFWIPFALLYLVIVAWWPHARALMALALTTMAMSAPVALLALVQWAGESVFWNERLQQANVYSRLYRVNGIFYDPNILGRYLVLAMLATVAVAWLVRDRPRLVLACTALLAVDAAGLAVTFSRSSSLMLMLGVAILAVRAFGWRPALAAGALLLVVGGGLAVAASPRVRDAATSTERLDRLAGGRGELTRGGVDIWRENPVVGGGLGSFAALYEQSLSTGERRRTRVVISHNAPVTILSEVGVIGFAAFLWLVGGMLVVAWRATRVADPEGWAAVAMAAMLAGILLHSLFYSALFEDPYTWVLAAGLVAVAAAGAARPGGSAPGIPAPAPASAA